MPEDPNQRKYTTSTGETRYFSGVETDAERALKQPPAAQLPINTNTPTALDTRVPGTTDTTRYSRYTEPVETPYVAKTEEEVQRDMTSAAQAEIKSLNDYYNSLRSEQEGINAGRDRAVSSVSTLTGLAGSTEANVQQGKQTDLNQRDLGKIENQRAQAIGAVLTGIRTAARSESRAQREEARLDEATRTANREKRVAEATEQVKSLAQGGTTLEGLKATDPEAYEYLTRQVGGDSAIKSIFTLNRPQDTVIDKKLEGGKYIIAYRNPLTGAVKVETVDLGLPAQYSKTVDAGDRIIAIPDNWDGTTESLITINKGLTPSQTAKGSGGDTSALPGISSNALAAQPAYNKLGATQKKQADSLNNLVRSLNDYKVVFEEKVDPLGMKLFGADAALLETKLNSIIFAAAQAEGTGALQQADRQVIEKIIPNPTNLGAFGAPFRGGKEGSIGKIKDQIEKYKSNLSTYGLVPTLDTKVSVSPQRGADNGEITVISPNGEEGVIPASQLAEAIAEGYTVAQ